MGVENLVSQRKIRIGVAFEVRVVRESLAMVLGQWNDFDVVEMASLDDACPPKNPEPEVDIVLIGLHSEYPSVQEKIRCAKSKSGNAKVVVVGVSESASDILTCIESGASAYTPQHGSPEQLAHTLRMVKSGEVICPPNISAMLFKRIADLKSQVQPGEDDRLSKLTRRELEILNLISEGMSNKEIAQALQLELQTVKNYVHSILEKMRVSNRREAAAYTRHAA